MFVLPQEIDLLENTARLLKKASIYIKPGYEVVFDVTLCLSDTLTNWEDSIIGKDYFESKFEYIKKFCDWCESRFHIEYDEGILGCVSKRRESSLEEGIDAHIWLDCDMEFPSTTLSTICDAIDLIKEQTPMYVITPELVKIWDNTWDVLVNDQYKGETFTFNQECDIISIVGKNFGMPVQLDPIPTFKFAGGWVTVISDALLKAAPIPRELGHYGLEDLFVTEAALHMRRSNIAKPQQYVMRGLIVGENHRYRDDSYITNRIRTIDMKDEFRRVAWENFRPSLTNFINSKATK